MEPIKLKLSELMKMEQGEIPMTDEGKLQLDKWKETIGEMTHFKTLFTPLPKNVLSDHLSVSKELRNVNVAAMEAYKSLAPTFSTLTKLGNAISTQNLVIPRPIVSGLGLNPELFKSITAHFAFSKETMRVALASVNAIRLPATRIHFEQIGEVFRQIEADPVLKKRLRLLGEKEKLIYSVIAKWKRHLIHRIEHMPYEPFAAQFEYACYALIDNATSNEELDAIVSDNIVDALLNVAARISVKANADFKRRERKQGRQLKLPPLNNQPNSFTDLFKDANEAESLVKILRDVTSRNKKPVVDDTGNWIGKKGSISILIAWIDVLRQRGRFKITINDALVAKLLNNYFPGLILDTEDASIWRKITNIRNTYHAEFLQLIK